ncbi:ferritin-like protein [Streptomyces sp. NBC_01352]|uniref:ferritin-like domain-containing protein n=1 Tax=unclassified Streptomyces TaxID=2593676 RepID=UPI002256AA57|nr:MULTISPECIES: ferritin-like protein [unclassified Streptomyces]MCX4698376.1 ferritin-like protein [Streptomyces sp. NBC_01373]
MTVSTIENRDDLLSYLNAAMALEHATIPPYLTAYYSIHSGTNSDAAHIIRVIAVEEMLHLTLVANVLNAIGGEPDLTRPGFVPSYPAYLPDGENDFTVDLRPFSPEAVETFCKIERPGQAPGAGSRLMTTSNSATPLLSSPTAEGMRYYSIGEFYEEIIEGLEKVAAGNPALFCGNPARQVGPESFYSGGGTVIVVSDLDSARQALRLIADQGEGLDSGLYDASGELAHYYRFRQLQLGRYYQVGDHPDAPSGPLLSISWDDVYDVKVNARLADYPTGSELARVARDFNADYGAFLALLTKAFNGQPGVFEEAVWEMFRLRDAFNRLVCNPLPGSDGLHAAPTFEIPAEAGPNPQTPPGAGETTQAVTR